MTRIDGPPAPIAWAIFTPGGNVRLWSSTSKACAEVAEREGLLPTALYALTPEQLALLQAQSAGKKLPG